MNLWKGKYWTHAIRLTDWISWFNDTTQQNNLHNSQIVKGLQIISVRGAHNNENFKSAELVLLLAPEQIGIIDHSNFDSFRIILCGPGKQADSSQLNGNIFLFNISPRNLSDCQTVWVICPIFRLFQLQRSYCSSAVIAEYRHSFRAWKPSSLRFKAPIRGGWA